MIRGSSILLSQSPLRGWQPLWVWVTDSRALGEEVICAKTFAGSESPASRFPSPAASRAPRSRDTVVPLGPVSLLLSNKIFDIKFLLMKLIAKVNCLL